jgi:hypothetical protein
MFIYSSTCFGRSPARHQELMTAVAASGFTFYHGDNRAVFVVGFRERSQHGYHHDAKVKPEAAMAVMSS